jgi:hypothetical protein
MPEAEAQRASVGSTEAPDGRLARVGVLGPKQLRINRLRVETPKEQRPKSNG